MEDYKKRDLRASHTLWTIYILVSNNLKLLSTIDGGFFFRFVLNSFFFLVGPDEHHVRSIHPRVHGVKFNIV